MVKKCGEYGKLVKHGVCLKLHEQGTVDYFLERGNDIELIIPSRLVGSKNADFIMKGLIWEMKSPVSNNCRTLIVTMRRAIKQSVNIVVDLRRVNGNDNKMKKELKKYFNDVKNIKNLFVITKDGKMIEYRR